MKTKLKLGLSAMSVTELTGFATHAVTKITGNVYFTAPNPALIKISNATMLLQKACDQAKGAGPAQTEAMNKSREALETLLTTLGHYVEDIANDTVNVTTGAAAIILSAGMDVKIVSPRQKQVFTVSQGVISGSVDLTGASLNRSAHEWQHNNDVANASGWVSDPTTIQASTTISGLEVAKRYYFRHRIVTIDGATDWDDPVSILVA